jgi:hypothetical protein
MFEHQADGFLLRHQTVHGIPMSTLDDYTEYDHADDVDDSGVSGSNPHFSDASGGEGSNVELIPVLLPSTLGWDWCTVHGVKELAIKESMLRYAQANDSIHSIRLALGFKSALFRSQVRVARTQQTKTRAWAAIQNVDTTVHQHAWNYSLARGAYLNLQDSTRRFLELPPLLPSDLHVNTVILGAAQVGQRNTQLSWLWSFSISDKEDGTWMNECKLCQHSWFSV